MFRGLIMVHRRNFIVCLDSEQGLHTPDCSTTPMTMSRSDRCWSSSSSVQIALRGKQLRQFDSYCHFELQLRVSHASHDPEFDCCCSTRLWPLRKATKLIQPEDPANCCWLEALSSSLLSFSRWRRYLLPSHIHCWSMTTLFQSSRRCSLGNWLF